MKTCQSKKGKAVRGSRWDHFPEAPLYPAVGSVHVQVLLSPRVARLDLESKFYLTVHRNLDFIMCEFVTCRCKKHVEDVVPQKASVEELASPLSKILMNLQN